jgi:hypothetical protein
MSTPETHDNSKPPLADAAGSESWISSNDRMPQEPYDFPCWGYWGNACHGAGYDFRGPGIMRSMFNETITHWMPIAWDKLPLPVPPNDRGQARRENPNA